MENRLKALANQWRSRARSHAQTAELYAKGSMERRFVEHGAVIYGNCMRELMDAIQVASMPPASAIPKEPRKQRRQPVQ